MVTIVRYYSLKDETRRPIRGQDYLCRLLDNTGQPFYKILTWHGRAQLHSDVPDRTFWSGSQVDYDNVTHWAVIPTLNDE